MRIGSMNSAEGVGNLAAADNVARGKRFYKFDLDALSADRQNSAVSGENGFFVRLGEEEEKKKEETSDGRGEAAKIYEAVRNGEENPIKNLRSVPKVPYGYLAKDGVIDYKGVIFICDERSNSICLGDMSDQRQVISVTLSGGGHLKVNRDNLGQLSKAIGMFSPEDVNRILRAIHQDTKIQSMQKEIEDLEASVGERMASEE